MGQIIKVLGTLLAGLGLSNLIPNNSLQADANTSAEDSSNWSTIIALGGLAVGMVMWSMFGKKISKMFK